MKPSYLYTCLLLVCVQNGAYAATATGTLTVTATILGACTVNSVSSLVAFGSYTGIVNDATGSVSVTCTLSTPYTIALGVGAGTGGAFTNRVMTGVTPANTLLYNLYTTAGRTIVWGDGTGSTATVAGTGSGAAQAVPVYGRIPASQNKPPDSYSDTVAVTVTY